MTRYLCTVLALTGGLLLAGGAASAQAPDAARPKLISPVRGAAELGYTKPVRKREGNMSIATFKVKNLAAGPIAGLKIEEFWYDKGGDIVAGARAVPLPEAADAGRGDRVTLKMPTNPKMQRSQLKFSHGDGKNDTIKPKLHAEAVGAALPSALEGPAHAGPFDVQARAGCSAHAEAAPC